MNQLVLDGPLLLAAAVAALAGLVSFASPCVLPLVPGYLSYVTGLVGSGAPATATAAAPAPAEGGATATAVRTDERAPRGRMVLGSLLFVLGFTTVFVAITTAFGGLGRLLLVHNQLITQVMGAVTVLVGLGFLGWLPLLQRTKRMTVRPSARRRRMRSRTCAVSLTPSAAVGSSMMISSASQRRARPIATA